MIKTNKNVDWVDTFGPAIDGKEIPHGVTRGLVMIGSVGVVLLKERRIAGFA
jgi:hypothetical protein